MLLTINFSGDGHVVGPLEPLALLLFGPHPSTAFLNVALWKLTAPPTNQSGMVHEDGYAYHYACCECMNHHHATVARPLSSHW